MTLAQIQVPRFFVVAPLGRDGELICTLLNGSGYRAEHAGSIADVEHVDGPDILGLILTDEALSNGGIESLRAIAAAQPEWSDLPVLLLTSAPAEPRYASIASQIRMDIRSVALLDRPIRKEMLLSAVQVAYSSRLKQLEVREATARQQQSDEALRNTEKLAVAGRLAATMAHEVNNPLTALRNLLYLSEHSVSLDEARSFSRMAAEELERISEIVDHTLRFHRAPSHPAHTDLAEVGVSAIALFRGRMREKNIHETVVAPTTFVYCSAGEIRQAIVNLIGNAIDAMPNGGQLFLRVSTCSLRGERYARVTIADTGMGIQPDIRPCLFRQFFTTKGSRGTGLGLWLTRDIIRRDRGTLRFRSRIGLHSGTAFSLYLPCMAAAAGLYSGAGEPIAHAALNVA